MVANVGEHAKKNNETGVLKICELDVHCSELYTPTDLRVLAGWRLESHAVPICRLDVFKVRYEVVIVDLGFNEFALVSRYGIPGEDPCNMLGQSFR